MNTKRKHGNTVFTVNISGQFFYKIKNKMKIKIQKNKKKKQHKWHKMQNGILAMYVLVFPNYKKISYLKTN